jgi:hypothetical protein
MPANGMVRPVLRPAGKGSWQLSLTDPHAAWVARRGTDVDAEGTRANRAAEIAITETMVDRIERRFDLHVVITPGRGSGIFRAE